MVFLEDQFPFKDEVSCPAVIHKPALPLVNPAHDDFPIPTQNMSHSTEDRIQSQDFQITSDSEESTAATISPVIPSSIVSQSLPTGEPRRSTRVHVPPVRLRDFVCPSITSYNSFSQAFLSTVIGDPQCYSVDFLDSFANMVKVSEPHMYKQAVRDSKWQEAMDLELTALEKNHTWILTDLPSDKKAIGSKWVFKLKHKPDGSIERYKARLVAKGYNQVKEKDYKHTFSPVTKFTTVRGLLALATIKQWPVHQLDINNTFLHGFLDEEIYMSPPEGYDRAKPGQVCLLKRSLYGLKQASRQWNVEHTKFLVLHGFKQSKQDYSLFTKNVHNGIITALVYVDDLILTGDDEKSIVHIKNLLHEKFTIKDLGLVRYFLGLEISRSSQGMLIHQRKYIMDLLKDAQLLDCKPALFPLPRGLKLSLHEGDIFPDPEKYIRLVGRLLFLNLTRPDISYAVQHLSQFMSAPKVPHFQAVLHVLHYLRGTISTGLFYSS